MRSLDGLLLAVVVAVASTLVAAAPFSNGSFESISPAASSALDTDGYVQLGPAAGFDSTSLASWDVNLSFGSLDIVLAPGSALGDPSFWVASDGFISLDMNGLAAGQVSQTFDTDPGGVYHVTFDMSHNTHTGGDGAYTMNVDVAAFNQNFVYNTPGATLSNMLWQTMSFDFVALGSSSTLTFTSLVGGAAGAALDNVTVTLAVPEPATILGMSLGLGSLLVLRRRR